MSDWTDLNRRIVKCTRCPRLVSHCREIASTRRRAYAGETYWGKPVPNFGEAPVPLLIVGLAPGAHGANRTGRMFTGDRSGDWLYASLNRCGLASQPDSRSIDDGMQLRHCAISAVCHCAPPGNKPLPAEILECRQWLDASIELASPKVFLALGGIAWKELLGALRRMSMIAAKGSCRFSHGAEQKLAGNRYLLGSYHPSQQNTFTGRLTEVMLDRVVSRAAVLAGVSGMKGKTTSVR